MAKKSSSAGKDEFKAAVERNRKELRRSQLPTDEDFARAHALMDAQMRMFATVREYVFRSLGDRTPVHDIFLFPSRMTDFTACVFYQTNADVEACRGSCFEQAIKDAICHGLAATCDNEILPTVAFDFDSHENVKKKCNGNYYKYLR